MSGDVEAQEEVREAPEWVTRVTFVLTGVVHLWFWNAILNLTSVVNPVYFSTLGEMANVMTFTFQGGCVTGFLLAHMTGELKSRLNVVPGVIYTVGCAFMPTVLLLSSEKARIALWVMMAFVFGLMSGMQQVSHFALAAIQAGGVKTAYASAGQGIAGVISYGLCTLMTEAGNLAPRTCIVINLVLAAVWCIMATFGVHYITNTPGVKRRAAEREQKLAGYLTNKPKVWSYIKWEPLLVTFFIFMLSYSIFPSIGPVHWGTNGREKQMNIVMGLSQLGQFVGRSIPNWSWAIIPLRVATYFTGARIAFIIAFIITAVYINDFTSSYAWQMMLLFTLSFTEGWIGTIGLIYSATSGSNAYENARMASVSVGLLMFGVLVGLALCPLLRIISRL